MKNIPYFRLKWSKSQGLLKHCPQQVDFPSGQVTFHQASCLPTKSLKDQTKPSTGQAKFESYLFQGQIGLLSFFRVLNLYLLQSKSAKKPYKGVPPLLQPFPLKEGVNGKGGVDGCVVTLHLHCKSSSSEDNVFFILKYYQRKV